MLLLLFLTICCFVYSNAADVHCSLPHQCIGTFNITDSFYVWAYEAASGPSTSYIGHAGELGCNAALSCHSMEFIKSIGSKIDCSGSESCSNTTIQTNTETIYCNGFKSCQYSTITSVDTNTNTLECNGAQSCAYSHIESTEIINANGVYSLYASIIDTNNTSQNLTINLNGERAGYGATLLCRSYQICNINCNTHNACYMLYIDCVGTCIVNAASNDFVTPIRNVTDVHIDAAVGLITESTDEVCNAQSHVYDLVAEREGNAVLFNASKDGLACCRGAASCRFSDIAYESIAPHSIICSGQSACYGANITANNATVFCIGGSSCQTANIINASRIYCAGQAGCAHSTIYNAQHVVCSGEQSCRGTQIQGSGNSLNVYLEGSHPTHHPIDIYCNGVDSCNIFCVGLTSCSYATVHCPGYCSIECDEASECPMILSPNPTKMPTTDPTVEPTVEPTVYPTIPTVNPTVDPTTDPTNDPTNYPTSDPTTDPTTDPTNIPTNYPTTNPTIEPTTDPTVDPTTDLTVDPSTDPTLTVTISSIVNIIIYILFGAGVIGGVYLYCKHRGRNKKHQDDTEMVAKEIDEPEKEEQEEEKATECIPGTSIVCANDEDEKEQKTINDECKDANDGDSASIGSLYDDEMRSSVTPQTDKVSADAVKVTVDGVTVTVGEGTNSVNRDDSGDNINDNDGCEKITEILKICDADEWRTYLGNFKRHKVTDNRLDQLSKDDWDLLIPSIGPRNEFRSVWNEHVAKSEGSIY